MYRIIGSDGKEYGPVSAQQLRQWIAEGRLNAQSQILDESVGEWKPLSSYPEFMVGAAPAPGGAAAAGQAFTMISAANLVSGPATGLIATAIIGFLYQLGAIIMQVFGFATTLNSAQAAQLPHWVTAWSGTATIISGAVGLVLSGLILAGGLKMKKLESYGLVMAASIVAAIPCVSPCCLVGLPIGIWAISVLNKPEVKDAFNQNKRL